MSKPTEPIDLEVVRQVHSDAVSVSQRAVASVALSCMAELIAEVEALREEVVRLTNELAVAKETIRIVSLPEFNP